MRILIQRITPDAQSLKRADNKIPEHKLEANTASNPTEVDKNNHKHPKIQDHRCKLIDDLSVDEDIYHNNPEYDGIVMRVQEFNDLIKSISGVGAAFGYTFLNG